MWNRIGVCLSHTVVSFRGSCVASTLVDVEFLYLSSDSLCGCCGLSDVREAFDMLDVFSMSHLSNLEEP